MVDAPTYRSGQRQLMVRCKFPMAGTVVIDRSITRLVTFGDGVYNVTDFIDSHPGLIGQSHHSMPMNAINAI